MENARPDEFIKKVLSYPLPPPKQETNCVFHFLNSCEDRNDLIVFKNGKTSYMLSPGSNGLRHLADGDAHPRLLNLVCSAKAPEIHEAARDDPFKVIDLDQEHDRPLVVQVNSARDGKSTIEATFVPLGSLMRLDGGPKSEMESTGFFLLMNVSTKPYSLWVVFDHFGMDQSYTFGQRDFATSWRRSPFQGSSVPATNATNEHTSDKIAVLKDCTCLRDDDGYVYEISPVRPNVEQSTSSSQIATQDCPVQPFDLALLESDITEWNPKTGLDFGSVIDCVVKTSVWLGPSLRAAPCRVFVSDRQKGPLKRPKVDLEEFILGEG